MVDTSGQVFLMTITLFAVSCIGAFLILKGIEMVYDCLIWPILLDKNCDELARTGLPVTAYLCNEQKSGYIDCTGTHETSHSATYRYEKNGCYYTYECDVDGTAEKQVTLYYLPGSCIAQQPKDFFARKWSLAKFTIPVGLLVSMLLYWNILAPFFPH